MRRSFISLIIVAATAAGADARLTASDAFERAPLEVMPLIDFSKRLEMIQLFEADMADKADPNVLGGAVRLLNVSDDVLTLEQGNGSTLTIALLPMAAGDTAVMMLENIETPAIDANVRIFSRDWKELTGLYSEPTVADWAVKGATASMTEIVPFMLASGEWNSAERTLTLTPTISQWLDNDSAADAATMMRPQLRMIWNGKKFKLKK